MWTNVKRKKASEDETKKNSRTSPGVQFNIFSLTKHKTRTRTAYDWIGNLFSKKSNKKTENQSQNAACEQKRTSKKWKFGSNNKLGLEWTMNGLQKPFRKKSDPKNWKTAKSKNSKNQSEIADYEQKITSEKANFCSKTVFSLYFKKRAKNFHNAKPLAFSFHFPFRRDQNHYSNLTSKIIIMCEQILKKDSAPIQFKFFEL